MQPPSNHRPALSLLLIAVVGLTLTGVATWLMRTAESERWVLRFERSADVGLERLRDRLIGSFTYLEFLGGLVEQLPQITRDQFDGFTRLAVTREPAMQALEWIPRVPHAQRAAFEAAARADGSARFRITEHGPQGAVIPAGERPAYFPVRYVTPLQGNEQALGFDLGSESSRRQALLEARDSGRMVASAPIRLVQGPQTLGFLVFLPVYRDLAPAGSLPERRAALQGFALGVFRVSTLVQVAASMWEAADVQLQVRIVDRTDPAAPLEVYASPADGATAPEPSPRLRLVATIPVANRSWQVILTPHPDEATPPFTGAPLLALLLGTTATAALCGYLWRRDVRQSAVEALVAERTRDLIDVTAAVEDRERRLRAIHDTVLDGIVTIDDAGIIQTANPAAARLFGYAATEMHGRNVKMLMPEPMRSEHDGYLSAFLRTGHARIIGSGREVLGLRKDGSTFPLDLQVNEMRIGSERHFTGVLRDLSDVRAAEQALRTSEERLRTVVTGTDIILYAIDRNGIFTLSEGRGLQAIGRKAGEVVGLSVAQVYADHPQIRENVRRALAGEMFVTEVPVRDTWSQAYYAPTYDAQGRIDGVIGVAIDITERKRAEAVKSEFVSTVSHELRTPLASIVGYVDLILDEEVGPVTGEMREFLQIIAQNGTRLTCLISDILDIEKLEAGSLSMHQEPLDLRTLLGAVQHTFQVLADKKGLALVLECPPGLRILGDANRLTQLFGNLVSNAIKYTRSGSIHIRAARQGDWIEVAVADTGIGMEPGTLEQLFTRFFRADDAYARAAGGTGLGLAIARAIAIQHRGTLGVRSQPSQGSVFTVALPCLDEPGTGLPARSTPPIGGKGDPAA